jgi:hypothetical protein
MGINVAIKPEYRITPPVSFFLFNTILLCSQEPHLLWYLKFGLQLTSTIFIPLRLLYMKARVGQTVK